MLNMASIKGGNILEHAEATKGVVIIMSKISRI